MKRIHRFGGGPGRGSGGALVATLVFVAVVAVFSATLLTVTHTNHQERLRELDERRAFYTAQAGVHDALASLLAGGDPDGAVDFGGGEYSFETTDLGDGQTALVAVAQVGRARAAVELVVGVVESGGIPFGVFGRDSVLVKTGAVVDSYDSRLGAYEDQVDREHALVHSNGGVTVLSPAEVHGDAQAGPGYAVAAEEGAVTGETGAAEEELGLDPIEVPVGIPDSGVLDLSDETQELASGTYSFSSFKIEGGAVLTVNGPATLVLGDMEVKTGAVLVCETSGGPIEIYCTGQVKVETNGRVLTTTQRPSDLKLNIHAPESQVKIQTDADMHAVLYAPDTKVSYKTEGAFYGAVAASELLIETDSVLHLDLALSAGSGSGGGRLVPIARRSLPDPGQ